MKSGFKNCTSKVSQTWTTHIDAVCKANKKSLRFLVIGLKNQCMLTCRPISGCWNQTKFPSHKVWWLREASQIRQTFMPLCEKLFKTQRSKSSNRSRNIGCNWTSFHINNKIKLKMPTRRTETKDKYRWKVTLIRITTFSR